MKKAKKEKQEQIEVVCSGSDSCEKEKCTHKKAHKENLFSFDCVRIHFCKDAGLPVRCKETK